MHELLPAFFAAVSFEAGGRPDYGRIRDLFIPEGLLIRSGDVSDVEGFIAPRQASVDSGALTEFEETELEGVTEAFGNVAHRLCGYAKRGVLSGEAFTGARGDQHPVRAHPRRLAHQLDGLGRRARRSHCSRKSAVTHVTLISYRS